jgi:prepilin-type N-terminal cleavage/methylation domain-containing protein
MRRGFTLVEIMVVIVILPFVMVLLDGLFRTILSEIPASYRIAQENTTLLNMLEQMQRDIDKATGLPASFGGQTASDTLLLIELPDGVVGYELQAGRVIRTRLTGARSDVVGAGPRASSGQPHGVAPTQEERTWALPHAKIEWQVRTRDGQRYAVQIQTYIEHKSQGRTDKKMANSHLYFVGAF